MGAIKRQTSRVSNRLTLTPLVWQKQQIKKTKQQQLQQQQKTKKQTQNPTPT